MTDSIKEAVTESTRRREAQLAYNEEHHITPKTIHKSIERMLPEVEFEEAPEAKSRKERQTIEHLDNLDLEKMMWEAVEKLQFEKAAKLRDMIQEMEEGRKPSVSLRELESETDEGGKYFRAASGNRRKKRQRT